MTTIKTVAWVLGTLFVLRRFAPQIRDQI